MRYETEPRLTQGREKSTLLSIPVIYLLWLHCQSGLDSDGSPWWTPASPHHMTSSLLTFQEEILHMISMLTSWTPTCTPCSAILQSSSYSLQKKVLRSKSHAMMCGSKLNSLKNGLPRHQVIGKHYFNSLFVASTPSLLAGVGPTHLWFGNKYLVSPLHGANTGDIFSWFGFVLILHIVLIGLTPVNEGGVEAMKWRIERVLPRYICLNL